MAERELVVLLDDQGSPIGTMPKEQAHTADTPLHAAFSCFGFDGAGRLLLTRRALTKRTWGGVWTGTCCGHPGPEEDPADAVVRRLRDELGVTPRSVDIVLPNFRYRAVAPNGLVENEICPVFTAVLTGDPRPDPAEVAEWRWVEVGDLVAAVRATPFVFSPWLVLQIDELLSAGRLLRQIRDPLTVRGDGEG
jgi:isopentenyl-diphosphate delta-isomerase